MASRCAAVVLALLALPTVSGAAHVEGASAGDREAARERFREGAHAYSEGRFKDAIDLFLDADRIAPNPAFAYNIGQAYEELGDAANALRWYRSYLRDLPNAPDQAEVTPRVVAAERHLTERGVQQVTVLSSPEGATVSVDGDRVGVAPWTAELPPGSHRLGLELKGFAEAASSFDLPAARAIDVVVSLTRLPDPLSVRAVPVASPDACADTPPPGWAARIRPVTWATLGVGVAGLGTALGLELARKGAATSARDAPTNLVGKDEYDRAKSLETAARVAVSVGGTVTALVAVLIYVDLSAGPARDARVGAAIGCPGGSCGLRFHGAF